MKVSKRAPGGVISEILPEPLRLLGSCIATADLRALAIQRDNVPLTQIVAVVLLVRIARRGAEVVDVTGRADAVVFMISRCRPRTVFKSSPGGAVAVSEVLIGSAGIGKVTDSEHSSWNFVDELCCGIRAGRIVQLADSGADEDGIGVGIASRLL